MAPEKRDKRKEKENARTSASSAHAGSLIRAPDNLGIDVLGIIRRNVASAAAAVRNFGCGHRVCKGCASAWLSNCRIAHTSACLTEADLNRVAHT